jgi:hypothetical protein
MPSAGALDRADQAARLAGDEGAGAGAGDGLGQLDHHLLHAPGFQTRQNL